MKKVLITQNAGKDAEKVHHLCMIGGNVKQHTTLKNNWVGSYTATLAINYI